MTVPDIERVLDRRHLKVKRRPGNIKPEFIAAYMGAGGGEAKSAKQILTRISAEDVPSLHGTNG